MRRIRKGIGLFCAVLMLLCSGCGMLESADLEDRLRPPRLTGRQEELQQALDDYLTDDYVLTYPRSGGNRASFLFEDMDGDGTDEAVCFYRIGEGNTHVLLLRREEESWKPINDMQGGSIDIDWVACGDMHGDGGGQLLIGWGIYNNSRDRQVVLYSLKDGELVSLYESTCAAAFFGDVMGSGEDTLLLYRIDNVGNKVTADLMALRDGRVTQVSSVQLDGYIRTFSTPLLASLDGKMQNGVFVDGYKDANSTVTELIYWDGTHLCAPFYDIESNANTITVREATSDSSLTGVDVNGDGRWEWPQNRRLVGYQTAEFHEAQWLTMWMHYDPVSGQAVKAFDSLVNLTDRYLLMLESDWMGENANDDRLTMRYDAAKHLLEVQEVRFGTVGDVVLRITPASREMEEPEDGEVTTVTLTDNAVYTVWYQPDSAFEFTSERIRYMLTALP